MVNKILVTGSLGQIGSYLCEELLKNNKEVIGLDNETNICPNLPKNIKKITVKGNIQDQTLTSSLIKDVDAVVHCAAQVSVEESIKRPCYDMENNIVGTVVLLHNAMKCGSLKRFVYLSSAATYGTPVNLPIDENHPQNALSPYGLSKLTGERYAHMFWRLYQLPTTIIRPFNIYSKRSDPKSPYSGVITKFIDRVKSDEPPIITGDGEQTRDFIHVNDVIQMIRLVLEKKEAVGESFNCGSGKPVTINQLADDIIKISQKNLKSIHIQERLGDISHSYANLQKAKHLLNYKPQINLLNGLKEIMNFSE